MIRVLNIVFDDRVGGPPVRIIKVAKYLSKLDVVTIFCCPNAGGNAADYAKSNNIAAIKVNITKVPKLTNLYALIHWMLLFPLDVYRIYKVIKDNDIDIVHVNGAVFLQAAFAAKISRKKLVWHLNDTIMPSRLAKIFSYFVKLLSDKIVVAAKAVAKHYYIPVNDCAVIYPPTEYISETQKHEHNVEDICIGSIANWSPIKGHRTLFEAINILIKNNIQIKLILAGAKLETNKNYTNDLLEYINSTGLDKFINDLGYIQDPCILLDKIDIYVLASISEASPIVLLEAMSMGLPLVATDVGGVREMLTIEPGVNAGVIVPPNNPEALSDAIEYLVKNNDMAMEMGNNGRLLVKKYFTTGKCSQNHKIVYDAVMNNN